MYFPLFTSPLLLWPPLLTWHALLFRWQILCITTTKLPGGCSLGPLAGSVHKMGAVGARLCSIIVIIFSLSPCMLPLMKTLCNQAWLARHVCRMVNSPMHLLSRQMCSLSLNNYACLHSLTWSKIVVSVQASATGPFTQGGGPIPNLNVGRTFLMYKQRQPGSFRCIESLQ